MTAPKKWMTSTLGGTYQRRHPTLRAALERVEELKQQAASGQLRPDVRNVTILVDDGSGWKRHEMFLLFHSTAVSS